MRKSIILFIMLFASYIHAEHQVEQVLDIIQENKIQFVNFLFVNLHGDIKEVTVPAHHVSNALKDGLAFDGSSIAGCANIAESDMLLKPDMDTFRIIPWLQGINKTAVIICDIWLNEDEPYPGDPRSLLKKLTHELNQMGLQFNVGPELEFFFVKKNNNTPCDTKCYWDIETDIQRSIQKSTILFLLGSFGINVEKLHHEVASGQHEISLRYNNAVSVADQLILAKYALKTIALQYDLRVTFMPKPFAGQNGSAMHIHFSLWDLIKNQNAFYHKDGLHQLSKTAESEISAHTSEAKSYQEMVNIESEQAIKVNTVANQQFVKWLPQQPAPGSQDGTMGLRAAEHILNNDPEMTKYYVNQWAEAYTGLSQNVLSRVKDER